MKAHIACPKCEEKVIDVSDDTIRRAKSPKHMLDILVKRFGEKLKWLKSGRCPNTVKEGFDDVPCGGYFFSHGNFHKFRVPSSRTSINVAVDPPGESS